MKKSLFMLFVMLYNLSYSQQNDSIDSKNSFLLFEMGVAYHKIKFKDALGEVQLANNAFNVSSNRFALGFGADLVDELGYILTLSNNRYDIRTLYKDNLFNSQYFLDYLALDANLTLRIQDDDFHKTSKWTPFLRAGLSFNYLVAGFQELNNDHLENLKDNNDFTDKHIDLMVGLSLKRKLTENTQFRVGYMYKRGFMENENISQQKYSINSHNVSLGFSVFSDALKRQKRERERLLEECKHSIDSLREELLYLVKLKEKSMSDEWKAYVTPDGGVILN